MSKSSCYLHAVRSNSTCLRENAVWIRCMGTGTSIHSLCWGSALVHQLMDPIMKYSYVFIVLALATTLASELHAQTLSKASSDALEPLHLPDYRGYERHVERAATVEAKTAVREYLQGYSVNRLRPRRLTGISRLTASVAGKTLLHAVEPAPNLADRKFYDAHSTTRLANGDVALVYREQGDINFETGEVTSGAEVRMVSSNDDGVTWSSPTTVRSSEEAFDFDVVRAVVNGEGRLVVGTPGTFPVIRISYSDDGGTTWQTSAIASGGFGMDMKPVPDGSLVVSYGRAGSFWMRTSANGQAWGAEKRIINETQDLGIFDGTIVALSATDLIFLFVEAASDGLHLTQVSSSDGGGSWSTPKRILVNPPALNPRPALTYAPDGTTWLVYTNLDDIWYMMSTDGGGSWSEPGQWTRYTGIDWFPSISMATSAPLVSFTSPRTFENHRIWLALLSSGADSNPSYLPPSIFFDNFLFQIPPDTPMDATFFAADETGVSAVELYYTVDGVPSGPVPAADDGNSGDGDAGDGVWGATLPGIPFGATASYEGVARDTDGGTASTGVFDIEVIPFHNVGNLLMGLSGGGFSGMEWPAGSGDDYFCCGGLWIGANVGGNSERVILDGFWQPDPAVTPSIAPGDSDQDIVTGLVEADFLGPDDRLGVKVLRRSYQWASANGKSEAAIGRENGVAIEIEVTNTGSVSAHDELFVGWFLDMDIFAPQWGDDLIGYDPSLGLLYMHDSGDICTEDPEVDCPTGYVGIAVLSDAAAGKSVGTVGPFTAGWDDAPSAFEILTGGINSLLAAGGSVTERNDYRMAFAAQPFSLAASESKRLAFAIALGEGLSELTANIQAVETAYQTFVVSVEDPADSTIPEEFSLGQNYPNPFNPTTTISYALPKSAEVELTVFNVLGKKVETLVSEQKPAGVHEVTWDATNLPSGIYLYRLNVTGDFSVTKSLVLVR